VSDAVPPLPDELASPADPADPALQPPDPARVPLDPAVAEDAAKLAGIFRWLAEVEFPGYSPLYEHLALRIADEPWIPALISRHNRSSFAAVLFLDCVRELTLDDPDLPLARRYDEIVAGADPLTPDPWPLFRQVVVAHQAELATLLATRAIQTNEVGRSAALFPAFEAVSRRFARPLALIEIGCSAGLNLYFDRFHIDYGTAGSVGPADSPVHLSCALHGSLRPPLPARAPGVASRLGIDINPVDVTDPIATRWLEACIWPDVPHRLERLRAAIALVRLDPPEVRRGNAVELVAEAILAVPDDAVACLDSTWVLAYLSDDERADLHRLLDELGADRSIAYVTAEYPGNVPWLPESPRPSEVSDHTAPTLLGLGLWDHGRTDHRCLAWMPPHGQWLEWLDSASGSPSPPA
jgi:hypothetical protein